MPILLGALSSLFIGVSDTLGRAATRRSNSPAVVGTAMFAGAITAVVLTFLVPSDAIGRDLLLGCVSGVFIASALAVMYRGMATSSAAVVSPLAAVGTAFLPLAWDLAQGTRLGVVSAVGCALAIVSLVFTTYNPDLGDAVRSGVLHGLAAGVLFAAALVFVGETSEASGAWPAATQRATGFIAMALLATRQRGGLGLTMNIRRLGLISGVFGTVGIVALVVGIQRGELGEVAVAGSMYPAVVAVLSATFDDDQLRWWQGIGIGGAITGLALIGLGSG